MANTVIVKSGGIGIDTTDFRVVAKALRLAGGQTAKNLRRGLRAAGEIVATEARAISSANSKKIPPTIKVRVTSTTVSVVAGGNGVPEAGLFEMGNAGRSASGTFRHPVFGDKEVWVDQPMHPFLKPAAANKENELETAVVAVLDDAVKTITFSGA